MSLRLNLGSGTHHLKGFVNIDSQPGLGDLEADILDLPYEDNSVDEIYAGHVLEHLFWGQRDPAFEEWKRVLKPGGVITITVPDVVKAVELYNANMFTYRQLNDAIYGNEGDDDPGPMEGLHKMLVTEGMLVLWMRLHFENVRAVQTHPHHVAEVPWQSTVTATKA